jgi:hypothetical protein
MASISTGSLVSLKHGMSWSTIERMNEDDIDANLTVFDLSLDGTLEEKKLRLFESSQPIYPLPTLDPETPRGLIFTSLLDADGHPFPNGCRREDILSGLRHVGYRDDDTAEQTINIQLDAMVRYYGYHVERNDEWIIVSRR